MSSDSMQYAEVTAVKKNPRWPCVILVEWMLMSSKPKTVYSDTEICHA